MKTVLAIAVLSVALLVGGSLWSRSVQSSDPTVVSRNGLHWHPRLTILADGKPVAIPANIGLGATHQPIHTHDEDAADGVIHLEFSGLVRTSDTRLDKFFRVWSKDIHTAFGTLVGMTVNGATSTAYGGYEMRDGDDIVLRYE